MCSFLFFKQKTAYEMRISDWSSDVCSSDLRERAGQPAAPREGPQGEASDRWVQMSLLALANLPDYPAPVFMTLKGFDHIEASVFQVARSPGKNTVYLGCLFLVIGVFSMFYIRDRRIWIWIKPSGVGSGIDRKRVV